MRAEAQRKELLQSGSTSTEASAQRIKKLATKDNVISTSNDLTESMKGALKVMSEELEKSIESAQILCTLGFGFKFDVTLTDAISHAL